MTFGEKLSKLRKENNYTQEQLADILGVSRQSISKWESNITYPETDKLIQISKLFHCTTDYLLLPECETPHDIKQETPEQKLIANNRIFILSRFTKKLVSCFKVTASPVIAAAKKEPKYLLLGVDKVTILGEHTTQLGWYETEETIQKEISEISKAIQNGEASYTLKYDIEIDERSFDAKIKNENDIHKKFSKALTGTLCFIAVLFLFAFGGNIVETLFNIGKTLGNAIGDVFWK